MTPSAEFRDGCPRLGEMRNSDFSSCPIPQLEGVSGAPAKLRFAGNNNIRRIEAARVPESFPQSDRTELQ